MSKISRPSQRRGLYGFFTLSVNQVTIAVNEHVEFDTIAAGDLPLSTGAGQADGKVMLPGGHQYRMVGTLVILADAGKSALVRFSFYDVTNGAYITNGVMSTVQTTNNPTLNSHLSTCIAELTTVADTEIEVRIQGGNVADVNYIYGGFFVSLEIQEIPRG